MTNTNQASIIINHEDLLDPNIEVETVNKIIYEGDVVKLLKLSENPKFSSFNQDSIIAMGKAKIVWYKNTEIQIGIIITSLIISLYFQLDIKVINFLLFGIMIFLFLRLKSFNLARKNTELERILYIQKMLKDSDYSIDHLIPKS